MKNIIMTLLFSTMFSCTKDKQSPDEEEFSASNIDNLRIELEDKLTVPSEKSEALWYYMLSNYVASEEFLKQLNPNLKARVNEELFTDIYYDTPDLTLLERKMGLRHRYRLNLTDPENRKNGRALVQLKLNDISDNKLERGELKYRVNKNINPNEQDSFINIVSEKYREKFKSDLEKIKIKHEHIKKILTIYDFRKRIYVLYNDSPYLSISFDQIRLNKNDENAAFMEIEPELAEEVFTEADAAKKNEMKTILDAIIADIRKKFPGIERNLIPKYGKAFAILHSKLPTLKHSHD